MLHQASSSGFQLVVFLFLKYSWRQLQAIHQFFILRQNYTMKRLLFDKYLGILVSLLSQKEICLIFKNAGIITLGHLCIQFVQYCSTAHVFKYQQISIRNLVKIHQNTVPTRQLVQCYLKFCTIYVDTIVVQANLQYNG